MIDSDAAFMVNPPCVQTFAQLLDGVKYLTRPEAGKFSGSRRRSVSSTIRG
jgi:hypothetical protein